MKLESLRIQNFRACDDTTIDFGAYTCFVGPNGAGKSTVLTALNIVFRNTAGTATNTIRLVEEDYHNKDTTEPVLITATFNDISSEAEKDLRAYVRQGKLVVSAKAHWNNETNDAEVKQYGARLVMEDFAPYFKADSSGAKAGELKQIYAELRKKYADLPNVTTKGDMESALREYEESHTENCILMDSEDQFYGFAQGSGLLSKYIQWVYIPAVKDASSEQEEAKNTALGDLLQRTIRSKVNFDDHLAVLREEVKTKYARILDDQQDILDSVSSSLEKKLQEWAHPGAKVELKWNKDSAKSVVVNSPVARAAIGESNFIGEVARLGHGIQRAFIVTILHELAMSKQEAVPTLLLGFEEPELYQHPPQAKHLAKILEDLSSDNAQIIVTTHSPYFVSGKGFENIRMVRRKDGIGPTTISHVTHDQLCKCLSVALGVEPQVPSSLMATIEQILQPSMNEIFFSSVPILVEGIEDIAYISTYLELSGRLSDFRKIGGHFVSCEGKNKLSRPLAIAVMLSIPTFVVFDADTDKTDASEVDKNRRDNSCILKLCSVDSFNPLPAETLWKDNVVMWATNIGKEIRGEIGEDIWNVAEEEMRTLYQYHKGVKSKNSLLITATLEKLWNKSVKSPSLERLCQSILLYGRA